MRVSARAARSPSSPVPGLAEHGPNESRERPDPLGHATSGGERNVAEAAARRAPAAHENTRRAKAPPRPQSCAGGHPPAVTRSSGSNGAVPDVRRQDRERLTVVDLDVWLNWAGSAIRECAETPAGRNNHGYGTAILRRLSGPLCRGRRCPCRRRRRYRSGSRCVPRRSRRRGCFRRR